MLERIMYEKRKYAKDFCLEENCYGWRWPSSNVLGPGDCTTRSARQDFSGRNGACVSIPGARPGPARNYE